MEKSSLLKKIYFILLAIFLNIFINFFSRFLGFFNSTIIVGIFHFALSLYLLKINPFKKITGYILVFFIFFLDTPVIIHANYIGSFAYGMITHYLIYILASIAALLIHFSNKKSTKLFYTISYLILFVLISINSDNIFNYILFRENNNMIIGTKIAKIQIEDKNKKIYIESNGKIQVVDLWANSCGYCIKAFPKFEKLKNDFKNRSDIEFYAINVKEGDSTKFYAEKFLKGYTFKNYYAESSILKKLKFNAFPQYMLISKNGEIRYFGTLNVEKLETYNNMYNLINNEE